MSGLSSPVFSFDNDRRGRIKMLKVSGLSSPVFRFDNDRRVRRKMLKESGLSFLVIRKLVSPFWKGQ